MKVHLVVMQPGDQGKQTLEDFLQKVKGIKSELEPILIEAAREIETKLDQGNPNERIEIRPAAHMLQFEVLKGAPLDNLVELARDTIQPIVPRYWSLEVIPERNVGPNHHQIAIKAAPIVTVYKIDAHGNFTPPR